MQKKILFSLICLLLLLNACLQKGDRCAEINKQIQNDLEFIDSLKYNAKNVNGIDVDKIDSLNNDLVIGFSELAENDLFQTCDLNAIKNVSYLVSSDKKLCLASWDTEQGGTMIDYTNSVIFKSPRGTTSKQLLYGEYGEMDNSKIFFDTLITLTNKQGQAIYLAHGYGRFSSALPFYVLKAFMIKDSLVEDLKLFPEGASDLWLEYDLNKFKSDGDLPNMEFLGSSNKIKIPVIVEEQPTNEYKIMTFDGMKFIYE